MLEELQGEGQLQSTGQFSVDFEKALEKLGALSRQHMHRWIFFAAQAAVSFGATDLKLSGNSRSVSLDVHLPRLPERLRDGRALEGIEESSALGGEEAAMYSLRQALLWARALQPKTLALVCRGPHPGYVLTLDGQRTRRKENPAEAGPGSRLSLLLTQPGVPEDLWSRSLGAEATYRLSFCPVPVWFEDVQLSRGDSTHLLRNRQRRTGNVKLLERYVLCGPNHSSVLGVRTPASQPAMLYRIDGQEEIRRHRSCSPVPTCYALEVGGEGIEEAGCTQAPVGVEEGFCVGGWSSSDSRSMELRLQSPVEYELPGFPDGRVRARALFTRMRVSGAYLVCARHGMLLDPVPLRGLPAEGWVAVVASNSVGTDASGLKAVQDGVYERIAGWAAAQIFAIHERQGLAESNRGVR